MLSPGLLAALLRGFRVHHCGELAAFFFSYFFSISPHKVVVVTGGIYHNTSEPLRKLTHGVAATQAEDERSQRRPFSIFLSFEAHSHAVSIYIFTFYAILFLVLLKR